MTRVRLVLGPIAAGWLVCQAATLTLAPALLLFGLLDSRLTECTCTHGADANCPVHHRATAGSRVCVMQGLTTDATATLNVLFGIVGLVPAPALTICPVPTASSVLLECSMVTGQPVPPDPPPPRRA
jgi:hypothetical protein